MSRAGRLADTPLPRLLLELYAERYTGHLELGNGRATKTVQLRGGEPVRVTSSLARESLAKLLADQGTLSAEDVARVEGFASERSCPEEAALVGLKLIGPRDLVLAIREGARRRLFECFGWPDGDYRCEKSSPPAETLPFRIQLVPLVRDALAERWTTERMLGDLGAKLDHYPMFEEGFEAAAQQLLEARDATALPAGLHEEESVWSALQRANGPDSVAALWVLDALGVLRFRASPPGAEVEEAPVAAPSAAPPQPEIEIVITGGSAAASVGAEAKARPAQSKAKDQGRERKVAELRKDVLERHEGLRELDHYQILGLERDAAAGQVKRAYVLAAKRFHPDALTRVGLDDIKAQANEVFAQITKANEVLSDPDQRMRYDAELGGEEQIDADRIAQAEMLYRKGEILMRAGSFAGALEFLVGAVDLWPEDPAYQAGLGWALYKKNPPEPERAREHLEKAVALAPDDAESHQRLGHVLRELGDREAAQAALATARRIDPTLK